MSTSRMDGERGLARKMTSSKVEPEQHEPQQEAAGVATTTSFEFPHERVSTFIKWGVLVVYCLSNLLTSLNGYMFPPIAKALMVLWGVGPNQINLISVVSLVTPFLLIFPAMHFVDNRGLEQAYYISMGANMIASWARYALPAEGLQGYYTVLATQLLISLTHPFLLVLPARLSALYFPVKQRALATSLGTITGLLGLGVGLIMSPVFRNNVPGLYLFQAVASSVPLIASFAVFDLRKLTTCRADPELDTCGPAAKGAQEESFCATLGRIFKDWAFVRLIFGIAIGTGTFQSWIILVDQAARPSFSTPQDVMLLSGLFFGFGFVGAALFGHLADRIGDYVLVMRYQLILGSLFATLALAGWATDIALMVMIGFAFTGFMVMGLLPMSVEIAVEYSFVKGVSSEGTVCGLVNLAVNVASAILVMVSTPGNFFSPATLPFFWEAMMLLAILILLTLPRRYRRQEHLRAENEVVDVEEGKSDHIDVNIETDIDIDLV